jgi:hypothetical protein
MNSSIARAVTVCVLALLPAAPTFATPYASGVVVSGGNVSFVLNEDAGDVTISFDNNTTVSDLGPMSRGSNNFALGSHTNFSIVVSKTGNGVLTQISSDSNRYLNFYGPRGIAVNHNAQSPNFGRAYVVNANSGTAAVVARPTTRGIYAIGADQSDVLGKGDAATLPSPMFIGSSTTYAPHRVSIGSDDTVYVSDGTALSGGGSTMGNGVWALSADLTSAVNLFTNRSGSTNVYYGPVNSRPVVTGSLAQNNLVLYAVEWNITPYNSIQKHIIGGAASLPMSTAPTAFGNIGFPTVNGVNGDLVMAPDGKFFASAYRLASPSYETNLMCFDSNGTMLWNSYVAIGAPKSGPGDPFSNTYGLAVSPDGKLLATILGFGDVVTVNLVGGLPDLSTLRTNSLGGGSTARGIDFDAADNIYWCSGGAELVRIYSQNFSNSLAITSNDSTGNNGSYQFVAIAKHPQSTTAAPGASVGLAVTAYGANLSYHWLHNGSPVANATNSSLVLNNVSAADMGTYQVTVASGAATLTSANAVLSSSTDPAPPAITSQPQSQTVAALGAPAAFAVSATGYPLNYQWYLNGAAVANGTGSVLSIPSVQNGDLGTYAVVVSNNLGTATSSAVTLALTPPTAVWRQVPVVPGGTAGPRHDDIQFIDNKNGWVSQNANLYKTTDGGITWTTNFTKSGAHFRSVTFLSSNVGFAGNLGPGSYDGGVTDTNVLYRTFNGGQSWAPVTSLNVAGMQGFCAMNVLDSQHIYGGGRVRGPAFFAKSDDGGTNWTSVNLSSQGVMNGIMDVYFRDTNTGWVVGMDMNTYASGVYHGRISKTTDGGQTWTPQVTTSIQPCYFWKMTWPSTNVGYCSLQQNGSYNTVVYYKTIDGGNTWSSNGVSLASLGSSSFYLQAIGFVSTNEGWMGGASGIPIAQTFIHTTDGGATWSQAGYDTTSFMNRIRFVSPTLGYAAGYGVHVYSIMPTIVSQPQSQTVVGPTNVTLSVGVTSTAPGGLLYQWKQNGTNKPGATSSSLTLPNATRIDSAVYSVAITNAMATIQSSNAVIRVLIPPRLAPPTIGNDGTISLLFSDADGGAIMSTNDLNSFTVAASSNMVDWIAITNALTLTNGEVLFQDVWTNSAQRYYKVTEQ